ncbi:MAG: serpin family protein [Verrucomicrobiaceae bacterium]|nr:serpin family protein [Verrucomicrobiaceae bacterium]
MKRLFLVTLLSLAVSATAATPETAAQAVNAFGLDLHRQMPKEGNVCLSPYSIQSALGMTYLGASGVTQEEMARVLHLPKDKEALAESFAALSATLMEAQENSAKQVAQSKKYGGPSEALKLHVANRLFGQKGYEFRETFLSGVKSHFGAPMELMNFIKDHDGERQEINHWVEKQTQKRIHDLIPEGGLSADTRLVLVNALYFKAAWQSEFSAHATAPMAFHANGVKATVEVPTMSQKMQMKYVNGRGFQVVALPYAGNDLHFLLIVPDDINGVSAVEKKLTLETLLACAKAEYREVILHLPKFKITPPTVPLSELLQQMGMTTAFDKPRGSADFDAMAPKKPDDYLCISEVFHKTFIELDEKGTEAAAATAVVMGKAAVAFAEKPKPIELKADRPFLFAIQHAASGACLFLGRVSDPR